MITAKETSDLMTDVRREQLKTIEKQITKAAINGLKSIKISIVFSNPEAELFAKVLEAFEYSVNREAIDANRVKLKVEW